MAELGIDFGTSFCTMAALDGTNRPIVIRGVDGNEKIPTVIYWDANGNHEVGEAALNRWLDGNTPEERAELQLRTIRSIKRKFSPQYAVPMPDGEIVQSVDIVAAILRRLKEEAEQVYFHHPITSLRLTHPASFSTLQERLLKNAAENAGFQDVELLPEPIAAALGYAATHDHANQLGNGVLVYDLGGGTLDLAYVHREANGEWRIPIPPSGDPHFGGDDFDQMLYDFAERTLLDGGHFSNDAFRMNMEVLQGCRDIKERLSRHPQAAVSFYHQNQPLVFRVTREQFENLIRDRITNSISMVQQLLEDVTTNGYNVDTVVLIGGSSRIPLIREMLTKVLPIAPLQTMTTDIAVALGAAVKTIVPVEPPISTEPHAGERLVKTINGVDYAWRWCPAGEFMMGGDGYKSHKVTLTQGFWMLETPVTQRMWKSVMGYEQSHFKGAKLPMESVSWFDCEKFCTKLSELSRLKITLPTEAQWEYACRAGTTTAYS
ncbi:MAG: Hsp70 family protein, partial [Planctomycetia bacterium]|nr:Hsp70 family protein [Planctomycetia bacterium]